MCVGETYNPNGKHASLVIYVRGNTIPEETHITMTTVKSVRPLSRVLYIILPALLTVRARYLALIHVVPIRHQLV